MDVGCKPHVQRAGIALVWFNAFFGAICEIVIHRFMKSIRELCNALALEIHKTVYALNLSKNTLSASLKATEPIKSLYFNVFISVLHF